MQQLFNLRFLVNYEFAQYGLYHVFSDHGALKYTMIFFFLDLGYLIHYSIS